MPFFYHPVLNLLFEGVDSEDKYKGVVNDAMHTLATIVSLASRLRVVDQIRSLSQVHLDHLLKTLDLRTFELANPWTTASPLSAMMSPIVTFLHALYLHRRRGRRQTRMSSFSASSGID